MKKPVAFLTAAATAVSVMLSPISSVTFTNADAADSVKIMPIGDSITFGYGDDGGYRKFLDYELKQKSIDFDMVGPEGKNSASFSNNGQNIQYDDNHAGYSGFTIKQQYPIPSWGENGLLEKLKSKNAVKQAQPDIVLLIIGTNDMTANRNLNDCETDLHTLIDYILGDMPEDGIIFMGSIPEFTAYGGNSTRVGNYNKTVQKVAESYGDNVQFADIHSAVGVSDLQSDQLHPNRGGYEKMGKYWANVVEEYLDGQGTSQTDPDDPVIMHSDFENGISGWEGRGSAKVSATKDAAAEGSSSAIVTDRAADWNGIAYSLSSRKCPAGTIIDASAKIMQKSGGTVHFKMTMQYTIDGSPLYDTFAEGDAPSGEWIDLSAIHYTVKDGTDMILYFETDTDKCNFYLDEVLVKKNDGTLPPVVYSKGDANHSGTVDTDDVRAMIDYLLGKQTEVFLDGADMDGSGTLNVIDLSILKNTFITPNEPDPVETPAARSGAEYMASIRSQVTASVPSNVLKNAEGTIEHITYFSKKANRNKGANVWLPPGYDKNKKYPVFYVNHGYGGDESSMVNGMGVREIATNLIKSGDAEPMIIVFTNQYTDPAHEKQTGNGQADVPGYDNFVEDLPDSLMPYIETNYPVKTGRENTAIAGFSMGGRESLYIGMKCCDKIGYIGGGAPAPGIFPTQDQFMNHPGVMSKDEIRFEAPYEPYLLMIAGGTNDGMVNDYPKQYADLFTQHGNENIYLSVPGGGHDSSTVIPLMYNFIRFIFKA